ncbi:MAG: TetR/AcrR family transcriptional regulator [Solirubrobacteraceae bacterium]
MEGHSAANRPAHQLPAGRHGIPRHLVLSNQRDRLLDAVMQVVMRDGYPAMRIADVIAIAGVSRRTFYDNFANKEDAFLAAYDAVVAQLGATVGASFATGRSWPAKVSRGLGAFLGYLAAGPAVAHVCIVEVLAAGPAALERRAEAMARFRRFIVPDVAEVPAAATVTDLTVETTIGGIYEVIYSRVVAGRADALPELLPGLLHTILLPFVGPDIAAAECARIEMAGGAPADAAVLPSTSGGRPPQPGTTIAASAP